jgi:peptidyl-prolyl cis-trans isomerase B (cyclophilin B)
MDHPQVDLHIKGLGIITLELNPEAAPETVENFLGYVKSGFYDGTIFHRVIPGFMIQGGGFTTPMGSPKPAKAPITNEANNKLKNVTYSLAMARTQDPHSATSQFFINVADNGFLDYKPFVPPGWGYCVFGRVIAGKELVDQIAQRKTRRLGMHDDVPQEDVLIEAAVLVRG